MVPIKQQNMVSLLRVRGAEKCTEEVVRSRATREKPLSPLVRPGTTVPTVVVVGDIGEISRTCERGAALVEFHFFLFLSAMPFRSVRPTSSIIVGRTAVVPSLTANGISFVREVPRMHRGGGTLSRHNRKG